MVGGHGGIWDTEKWNDAGRLGLSSPAASAPADAPPPGAGPPAAPPPPAESFRCATSARRLDFACGRQARAGRRGHRAASVGGSPKETSRLACKVGPVVRPSPTKPRAARARKGSIKGPAKSASCRTAPSSSQARASRWCSLILSRSSPAFCRWRRSSAAGRESTETAYGSISPRFATRAFHPPQRFEPCRCNPCRRSCRWRIGIDHPASRRVRGNNRTRNDPAV